MSFKHSIFLLSLLAVSAGASAQSVTDGSFENTVISGYEYTPIGTAWAYTYPAGLCSGSTPWHDAAEDGSQYAFVQSGSGVAGEISGSMTGLTAGASYDLVFYLGSRASYGIDPLEVQVGGDAIATNVAPADDMSGTGWTKFSYSFVAPSANASISFLGAAPNGGDLNTTIDNVSVQATPEPAPCAAFGLGALGLVLRRRSAKRS